VRDNAVVLKELRSRMRGGRAFLILTLYLFILSGFALAVFASTSLIFSLEAPTGPGSYYVGTTLFIAMIFFQLILVSFLTPAFTVGTITREKEQKTYDLLVTTRLSPLSIVVSKLFSASAYMFLLILASLPITGIIFMLGGVSVTDFALAYLVIMVTAVFFGSIGVFFSSLVSRTQFSTILAYAAVLFIILGTVAISTFLSIFLFFGSMASDPSATPKTPLIVRAVMIINPFDAVVSIFSGMSPGSEFDDPIRYSWAYTLGAYTVLTGFLLFMASRLVRPVNRWKFKTIAKRRHS